MGTYCSLCVHVEFRAILRLCVHTKSYVSGIKRTSFLTTTPKMVSINRSAIHQSLVEGYENNSYSDDIALKGDEKWSEETF